MGGHEAGEIASKMAIQKFNEFFLTHSDMEIKELIQQSLIHANESIREFSQKKTNHPEWVPLLSVSFSKARVSTSAT